MISKPKLALFYIITIMFILSLSLGQWFLTPFYIIFILVGLYDLGKDNDDGAEQ
jgi:hypothetical protein